MVPGIEAGIGPVQLRLAVYPVTLQQLVHLAAHRGTLGNKVSGGGPVVGVIVAVDDELHADGGNALLGKACNIAPGDIRRVDEHGRESQRVSIAVFLVKHFQLAVVFVYGAQLRHLFAEKFNKAFK